MRLAGAQQVFFITRPGKGDIADYYGDLLDGFVIDEHDAHQAKKLQSGGLPVLVAQTLMRTIDDRIKLAEDILDFSLNLDQPKQMSS